MAERSGKTSKYRHIYGDNPKVECQYSELKNVLASGEGEFVAANSKFFAVGRASGGGPVYVRRLDEFGRVPADAPQLSVHRGKTWDMDFHPFITNMIATASDDCRVCVTAFPDQGLQETIQEADVTLEGHTKKAILVKFHPTAASILASASFDRTVKVWNIETMQCVSDYGDYNDTIFSMKWNYDGSLLATTSKDKALKILDPRVGQESVMQVNEIFEGTKSSKVFWVPRFNMIGATGFNRQSKQELKLYNLNDLNTPVANINFGVNNSVNMPHYDNDTSVLYLYGKGNGLVHYLEVNDSDRILYQLNTYRSPVPQKGGCFVPKKGLDVFKCEVGRFLKLTAKDVLPVSFIVPRKAGADIFQEDIFPDTYAGRPAMSAEEYLGGENREPIMMSLDPARRTDQDEVGVTFTRKATYAELEQEVEQLRARVAELEGQLGIVHEPEAPVEEPYTEEQPEE